MGLRNQTIQITIAFYRTEFEKLSGRHIEVEFFVDRDERLGNTNRRRLFPHLFRVPHTSVSIAAETKERTFLSV